MANIIPGQTTKEEVFQNIGEPDVVSEDGSRMAYHSIKNKAWILYAMPGGASGISYLKRQYIFSVTFDERIVLEKGVQGRPMAAESFQRQWKVDRIKKYEVHAEKSDLSKLFNGTRINIQNFTSSNPGQSEYFCFTGLLVTSPSDESFARYIRNAFVSELSRFNAFSPQGNISLTAQLNKIEYFFGRQPVFLGPGLNLEENFGSPLYEGCLDLSLTVNSSNGRSLVIMEEYKSPCVQGFGTHQDCECLVRIFMPAVQRLIGNLIRSPEFPALVKPLDADRDK